MGVQDQLDTPFRRAMLYVIEQLGEVGVMKLEKILYLADLEHYRRMGRKITGAKWVRHNFGPMAKSVVPSTKLMQGHEITASPETSGQYSSVVYRRGPSPRFAAGLDTTERASLDFVLALTRNMTATDAAKLTYNTTPMLKHLQAEAATGTKQLDVPLRFALTADQLQTAATMRPKASAARRLAFKRAELDRVADLQRAALSARG